MRTDAFCYVPDLIDLFPDLNYLIEGDLQDIMNILEDSNVFSEYQRKFEDSENV